MLGKGASSKHLSYGLLSCPARSLVAGRRTDRSRLSCTAGRPQSAFIVESRAHKSIYQGSSNDANELIKQRALDNSEQAEMVETQGVSVFGKSQLSAKYHIKIANIDWIFMTQIA